MIDSLLVSVNAVFPIFFIILLGYVLRLRGFLSQNTISDMNRLVFMLAMPMLLFNSVYNADLVTLFDSRMVVWLSVCIVISFILLWVFAEVYLRRTPDLIGAFVQVSFRCNYAIIGIPLVANVMGEAYTGMAAFATAFIVSLNNILAAVILSAKDPRSEGISPKLIKTVFIGVCKNFMIIAIVIGVSLNLFGLQLPRIAAESVNIIAALCTPLALIAIGGALQVSDFKQYAKPAVVSSFMKIIVVPLVFMSLSILLGFRGEELAILLVMLGTPTAIASYVMAASMNANAPLTSAVILLTTMFSPITLTVGFYLLKVSELL